MKAVALAGLALLAAACAAPGEWRNPTLPEGRWSADRAACRSYARDKSERELALEQAIPGQGALGAAKTLESAMARYDAAKRRDRLFAACMTSRGYRKGDTQAE